MADRTTLPLWEPELSMVTMALLPLPPAAPFLKRLLRALIVVLAAAVILSRATGCCVVW
jgi:hypothetical protein